MINLLIYFCIKLIYIVSIITTKTKLLNYSITKMNFIVNGKEYIYENANGYELKRRVFEYALTHSTRETINYVRSILLDRFPGLDYTNEDCITVIEKCTPLRQNGNSIKLNPNRNDSGIIYSYSLRIDDKEICYIGKSYNEDVRRKTNFVQGYNLVRAVADDIQNGTALDVALSKKYPIHGKQRSLRTVALFVPTLQRYIEERDYIETNFQSNSAKGEYLLSLYNYEVLHELSVDYNIYGNVLAESDKFLRDLEDLMINLKSLFDNCYLLNKNQIISTTNYIDRETKSINLYKNYLEFNNAFQELLRIEA